MNSWNPPINISEQKKWTGGIESHVRTLRGGTSIMKEYSFGADSVAFGRMLVW